MKSFRASVWITAFALASLVGTDIAAANENPSRSPRQFSVAVEGECNSEVASSLWVPPGTETWFEGKTLRFRVPSGYVVWTLSKDRTFLPLEDGGVECSCEGGGCDPVSQGGEIGCLIKPACKSGCCKRSASTELSLIVTEFPGAVRRATSAELKTLPLAPPQLLDIPEVASAVQAYINRSYAGRVQPALLEMKGNQARAPKGHVLLPVNIFGYLANALVPAAAAKCGTEEADLAKCEEEGGEGASCRCNAGTGCKYWSRPIAGVSGCDSGTCSRCEMLAN